LGIDPGLERVGFGIVDRQGSRLVSVAWGLIETPRVGLGERLCLIHDQLVDVLNEHKPDAVAIEKLFYAKNQTTVMDVARAAGVILYTAAEKGLAAAEYSPPEVKLAVVGNGRADKKQVGYMVCRLLGLPEPPKPDDCADALAVALTHSLKSPALRG
jgi:crossover junction endodeoxyribonuclease RuvC